MDTLPVSIAGQSAFSNFRWGLGSFRFGFEKGMCSLVLILCFSSITLFPARAQSYTHDMDVLEKLWGTYNDEALRDSVLELNKIVLSEADRQLFFHYLDAKLGKAGRDFFVTFKNVSIDFSQLKTYRNSRKNAYSKALKQFLVEKEDFEKSMHFSISSLGKKARIAMRNDPSDPCYNMDFETGSFTNWTGSTGTACQLPLPCALQPGYGQHLITTRTLRDRNVPNLSPVYPGGGQYSIRLGDSISGGYAAAIRRTFLVTPSNNIFTYRYACVLEDPTDSHSDSQRPYFKVRMYDTTGAEISCGSYFAMAKPPVEGFTTFSINGYVFLYRDWTTVSVPLNNLIGQQVTIEFYASDCSLGGHLGYAYLDAACFSVGQNQNVSLCPGENIILQGPVGVAQYRWSGPGVTTNDTLANLQVYSPGIYSLSAIPTSGLACAQTFTYNVVSVANCDPHTFNASLCPDNRMGLTRSGVRLNSYNSLVSSYLTSLVGINGWYKTSVSPSQAINASTPQTITNGDIYFAVLKVNNFRTDTVKLTFAVNPLPTVSLAGGTFCSSNTPVFLNASPVGGYFRGARIASDGSIDATTAGTFSASYIYTDLNGCVDSAQANYTINTREQVQLGPDQLYCSNFPSQIPLNPIIRNPNNTIVWTTNGTGTFGNLNVRNTNYFPSSLDISNGNVRLIISVNPRDNTRCTAAKDTISFNFNPPIRPNPGKLQKLCYTATTVNLVGSGTFGSTFRWTGGNGTFANATSPSTVFYPSASDLSSGRVVLRLSENGQCGNSASDTVSIVFIQPSSIPSPSFNYCPGNPVNLTLNNGLQYTWYRDTQFSSPVNLSLTSSTGISVPFGLPATTTGTQTVYFVPQSSLGTYTIGPSIVSQVDLSTTRLGNSGTLTILNPTQLISFDVKNGNDFPIPFTATFSLGSQRRTVRLVPNQVTTIVWNVLLQPGTYTMGVNFNYLMYGPISVSDIPGYARFSANQNLTYFHNIQMIAPELRCNILSATLVQNCTPLSIEYLSVSAVEGNVTWKTLASQDGAPFIIERSLDGNTFYAVGTVPSYLGNGTMTYHFQDPSVYATEGVFYRIKTCPTASPCAYSAAAKNQVRTKSDLSIRIFPNPSTGNVTLQSPLVEEVSVEIIASTGQVVFSDTFLGQKFLDLSSLPDGAYMVKLNANDHVQFEKLVLRQP